MKNILTTTLMFPLIATSILSGGLTQKADAMTSTLNSSEMLSSTVTTTTTSDTPKREIDAQSLKDQQFAQAYYYCEWDYYGNWICLYY